VSSPRRSHVDRFKLFDRLPEYWSGRHEPPSVLEFVNAVRYVMGLAPIESETRAKEEIISHERK
jgi:hypothetical protein